MKIGVICAPGGHLVQALAVLEAFQDYEVVLFTYNSDAMLGFQNPIVKKVHLLKFYGASQIQIVINLITSIPAFINFLLKEKPKMLFSTGSEITIPAFYIAKLLGIKLVFLETFVRSNIPTLTAKAVYPITDLFLVQWEHMIRKIGPRAKFVGSIL